MTESRRIIDPPNFRRRGNDRFEQHVISEMASLRTSLDVQFKRIAQLQAELDVLSAASKPHESLRAPMLPPRPSHNGNRRSHR
jgi:hypothetical protein